MAIQQGQRAEEHIDLVQDIKLHWKQPKHVLSRIQTWTTQQPIAVEAMVATVAGSIQVPPFVHPTHRHAFFDSFQA